MTLCLSPVFSGTAIKVLSNVVKAVRVHSKSKVTEPLLFAKIPVFSAWKKVPKY